MSKIIVRKEIRSIQIMNNANVTTASASIDSVIANLSPNNQVAFANIASAGLEQSTSHVAQATALAIVEAGFESVVIKVNEGQIRVVGTTVKGSAMVTELSLDTQGEVSSLVSDTLNADDCDKVNRKFDEGLRKYGVEFKTALVEDQQGYTCPKPPVSLDITEKLKKLKRNTLIKRSNHGK